MLRRSALLAIAAGALALPGVASAGTLTSAPQCWEQGKPAMIDGSGFTPDLGLPLTGEKGGGTADPEGPNGSFTGQAVGMPDSTSYTPRNVTITATDQKDPANNASITLMYVKYGSNLPVSGKHAQVVTWQFAGFPTGSTVYVHFRHAVTGPLKKVKDIRLGTAAGPCGTLTKRMMRVPVKNPQRLGDWFVQVDTHPRYSANTGTFFWYKTFTLH